MLSQKGEIIPKKKWHTIETQWVSGFWLLLVPLRISYKMTALRSLVIKELYKLKRE